MVGACVGVQVQAYSSGLKQMPQTETKREKKKFIKLSNTRPYKTSVRHVPKRPLSIFLLCST